MAGNSYNELDGVPESNAGPFVLPAEAGHLSSVTDENQKFVPVCQRPFGLQRYGFFSFPEAKVVRLGEEEVRSVTFFYR